MTRAILALKPDHRQAAARVRRPSKPDDAGGTSYIKSAHCGYELFPLDASGITGEAQWQTFWWSELALSA
jgi:hypothetical protein